MSNLSSENLILEKIKGLTRASFDQVAALLNDGQIVSLAGEQERSLQNANIDRGFNLFEIISAVYHRENLHSDVLRAVLDPMGKHREKTKYLDLFLQFIRSHGASIEMSDYKQAKVVREQGRMDLLIKDDSSKRAIIIENKINNASDTYRQIPEYLNRVTKEYGYQCDAIIYASSAEFVGGNGLG